jgi:O-antigen/teichoic acid export membrane protein
MSAVWDFGSRVGTQGLMFVVSLFLARLLTPTDFGIATASRFFITLASRLTQLGLNASLVRMRDIRNEHLSSVFVVNLLAGVMAFTTLYLASPALGRVFDSADVARVLPVTSLVFLITPFGTVASAMMTRNLQYQRKAMIYMLDGVAASLVSLVLAIMGFGYWSLVWGALSAAVIVTAAKLFASPWRPSLRFSMGALRDTLNFGLGFQAKGLLVFGATNLDSLIIGRLLGITSLGYYDKAYRMMHHVSDRMTFDKALMRIFAILRDEPSRFRKAVARSILATTLVSFPLLIFAVVTADVLIVVLFGSQWVAAVGPFRVLAVAGLLSSAMRSVSAANEALGLVWYQTAQQALWLSVMVTGVAIGAQWGLTTAAMGVAFGWVVLTLTSVGLVARYSSLSVLDIWEAVMPPLVMSAVMGLAVAGVRAVLEAVSTSSPWLILPAAMVVAFVTYAAAVLWTPFPSVARIVVDSIDDIVPWLRRWFPVGILRASRRGIPKSAAALDGASSPAAE